MMELSPSKKPCKLGRTRVGREFLTVFCALVLAAGIPVWSSAIAAQTGAPAAPANNQNSASKPSSNAAYQKYLLERRDVDKYQRRQERKEEIQQSKTDNPEGHDDADQYRHSPMVQSIAHLFGLSTETAARIFEALNFLVLLSAIVWFVARVLPKTLRSRKERIQSEIEHARAATEDADRRLADVEQRLSRLNEEIQSLQSNAEQETSAEVRRLRNALEEEKQRIADAVAQEVNSASVNAQRQLKNLAAELVIEHARRRIAVSAETDRSLVDTFVAGLHGERRDGGVN